MGSDHGRHHNSVAERFYAQGMEDDQQVHEWSALLADPMEVATMFLACLLDPTANRASLDFFVTPESAPVWGDYSGPAATRKSSAQIALRARPTPASGDETVAYVEFFPGTSPEGFQVPGAGVIVEPLGVLTLAWRPAFGRWMVHHLGDYILPEHVPR